MKVRSGRYGVHAKPQELFPPPTTGFLLQDLNSPGTTTAMLSILRKARLKDKEMRILML